MGAPPAAAQDDLPGLLKAATVGSLGLCFLCTPLDVVRHSSQAAISKRRGAPGFVESCRAAVQPGYAGLWRGIGFSAAHAALSPAAFLCLYEFSKQWNTPFEAAVIARAVQAITFQPLKFMRTCRQASAMLPAGSAEHLERGAWQTVSMDGYPRTLMRGLISTVIRDSVGMLVFLSLYGRLTQMMMGGRPASVNHEEEAGASSDGAGGGGGQLPALSVGSALAAGASAAAAAALTQPMDVVKTRMQVHKLVEFNAEGYKRVRIPRFWATLAETRRAVGMGGLWTGGLARVASAAAGGLLLGPFLDFGQRITDDVAKPFRKLPYLPPDTSRHIVHPRATKSMFIEVKGAEVQPED